MNQPDDFDPGMRDQLSAAIGAEPPMDSLPFEDAARGRRLERRRRWTTVGAAAAAVPALTLGAYAVSGTFGPQLNAPTTVQMQPADGGTGGEPSDAPSGTLTPDCSVSSVPGQGDGSASLQPVPNGANSSSAWVSVGPLKRFDPGSGSSAAPGSGLSAGSVPIGPDAQAGAGIVAVDPLVDPGTGDCSVVDDGAPIDSPDIDRVTEALNRHVDPDGLHSGMSITGGSVSSSSNPDTTSGIYVGSEWTDGDRTGMVSLSVQDSPIESGGSCADPSLASGPEVTCETQQLPDGTTALVGRGQQGGAERITVRYDRPDGTVVWATSDEATDQWWTDQTGAAPLASPPATVDQLIELVQDPEVRL